MTESNRLPILAAEIKLAHLGVRDAARTAAQHAIDAGERLIEAKALVAHGQWLPWLKEHCEISERSAQLYMKIVRLGFKSETVADIGIKAASKVLALDYGDPFDWCEGDADRLEYAVFRKMLLESGVHPDGVEHHITWLLRHDFKTPSEWLGDEGAEFRKRWRMKEPTKKSKKFWAAFLEEHSDKSLENLRAELDEFYKATRSWP